MHYLRTASFGGLFGVTFAVAASCQVALTLLGLIAAFMAPGIFKMNGEAANNPIQAVGVLIFMLGVFLVLNAGMSALGAGLWLSVRKLLPDKRA